jgi:hypothetical protein
MSSEVMDFESGQMVTRRELHRRMEARIIARNYHPRAPEPAPPTKPPAGREMPPARDPDRRPMGVAESEAREWTRAQNAIDNERIRDTPHTSDEIALRARAAQEERERGSAPVFRFNER